MSANLLDMTSLELAEALNEKGKSGGADLTKEFFYLGGPMSNLPGFNFPAFNRRASLLRDQGYNICNPAEFDHEIARFIEAQDEGSSKQLHAALAEIGLTSPTWLECLKRDLEYCLLDTCVGGIFMEGWEHSQGAQWESYTLYKALKPTYRLYDDGPRLEQFNRREALEAAGVVDG